MPRSYASAETLRNLRALTVCQPWAWAIVHGPKRWENRPQPFHYRGPLVIHAGKSRAWLAEGRAALLYMGVAVPSDDELVFGAAIGLAELTDCVGPYERPVDPFAFGPYCLKLEDRRPLAAPLYCRGKLGLWVPPPAVLEQILPVVHWRAGESGRRMPPAGALGG